MCAYYENGSDRIRRGDTARYLGKAITILESKHLKASRTMRIVYAVNDQEITLTVPYDTVIDAMELVSREAKKPRINEMGQEVVAGYACKPVDFDPKRPIMHYAYQLYVCDDERCAAAAGKDQAAFLRALLKTLRLNRGKHRIKISRSRCQGACRYRQVAQLNANTPAGANPDNNALWLRHVHRFSEAQWQTIFEGLSRGDALANVLDPGHFIPMKIYAEEEQ